MRVESRDAPGNWLHRTTMKQSDSQVGDCTKELQDKNGRINVPRWILSGGGMKSHVSLQRDLCRRLDIGCEEGINHQRFG